MLPIFRVKVLLNFTDKKLTFAPYRRLRKIVVHDRDMNIFGQIFQIQALQFLDSNRVAVAIAEFLPFVVGSLWHSTGTIYIGASAKVRSSASVGRRDKLNHR